MPTQRREGMEGKRQKPPHETDATLHSSRSHDRLKNWATWGVVIGTAGWIIFGFGLMIVSALVPNAVPESWLFRLIREHPGGTMITSVCAISAFSVVAVLDVLSRDPIEIRFFQFQLKGAAGPVVLWVVCFMAMVVGFHTLWDLKGVSP
jgi:hypothetical protein